MATWGQKKIKVDKYDNSPELYYSYSTSADQYQFIQTGIDDYTGQPYECKDYFSPTVGEGMMEAYICHILAFKGLTEEQFIDRFIKKNRFRSTENG